MKLDETECAVVGAQRRELERGSWSRRQRGGTAMGHGAATRPPAAALWLWAKWNILNKNRKKFET
jgi:hypothetical protein